MTTTTMTEDDVARLPTSKMHEHIARVIGAETSRRSTGPAKILDVGCGDGRLMDLLSEVPAEVHGLEVDDSSVQLPTFYEATARYLADLRPEVDWLSRLHTSSIGQPWPFAEASFDVVVSNQVGEHVKDIRFFMTECSRVLKPGGFGVHVFPLQTHLIEGHTGMPFGHRILSGDLRRVYYEKVAALGLSRLGPLRKADGESSCDFARTRSDYVTHETANHTWPEIAHAVAAAGMTPSYRYTPGVYLLKAFGPTAPITEWYYGTPHPLVDAALFRVLNRIASVTIVVEKNSEFDADLNALWTLQPDH
ncbi:MAG: class I SAM-dependent methyltransferase [Actinomycetota bacterium]